MHLNILILNLCVSNLFYALHIYCCLELLNHVIITGMMKMGNITPRTGFERAFLEIHIRSHQVWF